MWVQTKNAIAMKTKLKALDILKILRWIDTDINVKFNLARQLQI